MRGHRLTAVVLALAEDDAKDQSAPSRGHVHYGAASEIQRLDRGVFVERSAHESGGGPDHVSEREVHREHPDGHKQKHRGELHALGDGSDNQGRGDDGEGELEHGPHGIADPVVARAHGTRLDALEHRVRRIANDCVAGTEREAVSDGPPKDRHQSGDAHALSQHRKDVLLADQTAVEQRQSGHGHEQHQRGGSHLPSVVAGARASNFARDVGVGSGGAGRVVDVRL